MKVIDLLNRIANVEDAPKKIKYMNTIYTLEDSSIANIKYYTDVNCNKLLERIDSVFQLNEEIEIIEEDKKIEKLWFSLYEMERVNKEVLEKIENKINEIIDKINEMENKNEKIIK